MSRPPWRPITNLRPRPRLALEKERDIRSILTREKAAVVAEVLRIRNAIWEEMNGGKLHRPRLLYRFCIVPSDIFHINTDTHAKQAKR